MAFIRTFSEPVEDALQAVHPPSQLRPQAGQQVLSHLPLEAVQEPLRAALGRGHTAHAQSNTCSIYSARSKVMKIMKIA